MDPPQEPAKGRLIGDELQRLVRLRRGSNVGESERHTRDHLNHKGQQRGTAKYVPPARIARHEVFQAWPEQRRNPHPIIQPAPPRRDQSFHSVVVMGMAIVLICTRPLAVRTS